MTANEAFTALSAKFPTKHPTVSMTRNIILGFRGRLCTFASAGSATTSINAAVALAVVLSVILRDRSRATCAPEENARER